MKFNKAIAGGVGAAISTVVVALLKHFVPDLDMNTQQAVDFLIYTLLTGGIVYAAPANSTPEAKP